MRIRYANAGDNGLLAEFGAQTFYDSFAADNKAENMKVYLAAAFGPEKQAEEIADPTSVFLIAETGGEVVGYARLKESRPPKSIAGRRPIELVRIYAGKAWIGKGIGAALMRACLAEAAKRGHDAIWLGVWERNDRAQEFYRKWGFEEAGTQRFRLGDEMQTDLLMQREIASSAKNASSQ